MSKVAMSKNKASKKGLRILVVDDDKSVRQSLVTALILRGFEVMEACDGVEAHQLLVAHESEIDLVVTDYQMPRMNGLLLAGHAQKHYKKPVIMMSGDVHILEGKLAEIGLKVEKVLSKPFRIGDLDEAISKISG